MIKYVCEDCLKEKDYLFPISELYLRNCLVCGGKIKQYDTFLDELVSKVEKISFTSVEASQDVSKIFDDITSKRRNYSGFSNEQFKMFTFKTILNTLKNKYEVIKYE
jgi:tRNA U54 and U55 pseudouridine synthase Pus10